MDFKSPFHLKQKINFLIFRILKKCSIGKFQRLKLLISPVLQGRQTRFAFEEFGKIRLVGEV